MAPTSSKHERRDQLCDAAIAVLAELGVRGLTHHNVDDRAGVARGSTSYYYRTRVALIEGVMARIVELDVAEVAKVVKTDPDPVRATARLVRRWLKPPSLARTRARHEMFLVASREPLIAEQIAEMRASMTRSMQQAVLGIAGPKQKLTKAAALEAAKATIWLIDGLMFTVVRENATPPSLAKLTRIIESSLRANLDIQASEKTNFQPTRATARGQDIKEH